MVIDYCMRCGSQVAAGRQCGLAIYRVASPRIECYYKQTVQRFSTYHRTFKLVATVQTHS